MCTGLASSCCQPICTGLNGGAEVSVALAKPLLSVPLIGGYLLPRTCVQQWAQPSCSGSVPALLIALEQQAVSTGAATVLKVEDFL